MDKLLALALVLMAGPLFAETSRAADWVANEQIAMGCQSGTGSMTAEGLREVDLNNDGRLDLILDHAGMECDGTGMAARSGFCGAQVCSAYFYIRNDDGLLILTDEILGTVNTVSDASLPVISGYLHGGKGWSIVWSNDGFELIQ